jgi:hypothetical protein
MAWPTSLQVALKEWSVVCRAVEEGTQSFLLRKGGIYESAGEFQVEHREFLLFPTYLHQKRDMLKQSVHANFEERNEEPNQIVLTSAAVVTDIQIAAREQIDAIDDEHIWTKPLIDMRFSYRPENPLYLMLVRVYRLREPQTIANTPAYAGCKSWVPLEQEIQLGNATPVMDDVKFDIRRKKFLERINVPT